MVLSGRNLLVFLYSFYYYSARNVLTLNSSMTVKCFPLYHVFSLILGYQTFLNALFVQNHSVKSRTSYKFIPNIAYEQRTKKHRRTDFTFTPPIFSQTFHHPSLLFVLRQKIIWLYCRTFLVTH